MVDYEKLYYKAYNAITDVERLIGVAVDMLRTAQQECEEMYSKDGDAPPEQEI